MLRRLTIVMTEQERSALQALADGDMRPAREQLRWLLIEAARERGLLSANPQDDRATFSSQGASHAAR